MAEVFSPPTERQPLAEASGVASKTWFSFWSKVARKLSAAGSVAEITTADASDLPTAIALANANKAAINLLIQSINQQ